MAVENQPLDQAVLFDRNLVFFDVETNVPGRTCSHYELLEFGAVVLDSRGLGELGSFHTLIHPSDLSCIDRRTTDCNTITPQTIAGVPAFADVADQIYHILHGQIWAGHNILKFDMLRVNEAFSKIGQQAPQPFGVIDTYPLLRKTFGKRAGNYKLASLANYCGYGKQEHRSIADVRMNINVLRSCATILFLESNFPNVFTAQDEVLNCTSISEHSATLSTSYSQNRVSNNEYAEQEVNSQCRSTNLAVETSPYCVAYVQSRINGPSFVNSQLSEVTDSVRKLKVNVESEDGKLGPSLQMRKDYNELQAIASCTRGVLEDEVVEVSSVSKISHVQENMLVVYAQANEKTNAAEVLIPKSAEVLEDCTRSSDDAMLMPLMLTHDTDTLDSNDGEDHGLSKAPLVLQEDSPPGKASGCTNTKACSSSSVVHSRDHSSRTETEEPFLLASYVNLHSIEVREGPSAFGCMKTLYYEDFPLHVLERKIRIRFTVNLSYAFNENGKPRFSVLVEPSEAACDVIRKCEELVKSVSAYGGEVEWLPSLRKDWGSHTARMSIGVKCEGALSTYTTEFFRSTSTGIEEISLGHVDALTFRSMIPHGSVVDVGFGFYVFYVNNRAGVKLLAKRITLN